MWAIKANGVGRPVAARAIRPEWALAEGETFKTEVWAPDMVLAEDGASLRHLTAEEQAERDAAAAIPASVTRRQALQALTLAGKYDLVQPAIDALADPTERQLMQIEWDDSQEFERARPALIQMAYAIGLSDAELDTLFVQAAAL